MKSLRIVSVAIGLLILAACVTINIYFPSAEAQEAAEKIDEDILGEEESRPAPGSNDQSMWGMPLETGYAFNLLELLIPSVEAAAQPKFEADTPEVRKLQASMKQRHGSLLEFYQQGAIGFTQDALVGIRDISSVPLKQRGQLKNLVQAENNDRNRLYMEIAKANGHPEWEQDVRQTFSKTWVNGAAKGWWYQNQQGAWVQK